MQAQPSAGGLQLPSQPGRNAVENRPDGFKIIDNGKTAIKEIVVDGRPSYLRVPLKSGVDLDQQLRQFDNAICEKMVKVARNMGLGQERKVHENTRSKVTSVRFSWEKDAGGLELKATKLFENAMERAPVSLKSYLAQKQSLETKFAELKKNQAQNQVAIAALSDKLEKIEKKIALFQALYPQNAQNPQNAPPRPNAQSGPAMPPQVTVTNANARPPAPQAQPKSIGAPGSPAGAPFVQLKPDVNTPVKPAAAVRTPAQIETEKLEAIRTLRSMAGLYSGAIDSKLKEADNKNKGSVILNKLNDPQQRSYLDINLDDFYLTLKMFEKNGNLQEKVKTASQGEWSVGELLKDIITQDPKLSILNRTLGIDTDNLVSALNHVLPYLKLAI